MPVHVAGPLSVVACREHEQTVRLGALAVVEGGKRIVANRAPILAWFGRLRARLSGGRS